MPRDLGTYHVRVELAGGKGFIYKWSTGPRFTGGRDYIYPLNASPMRPIYESEEDLLESIRFMFLEGNYSCDCNKSMFIADAAQVADRRAVKMGCGDTLTVVRLTAIRPDLSEVVIYREPAPATA